VIGNGEAADDRQQRDDQQKIFQRGLRWVS
jgi:hypothetical protein